MYKSEIADYQYSSAVRQVNNYVSDTGECTLFSDLSFLPD
jgi:hypothetical protein